MVTSLDKNTALVLVDLQNGITRFPVAHSVKGILENSAKLVTAFRKAGLPIVIVHVANTPPRLAPLRKDAKAPAITFTDDWYDIAPEIKTTDQDIFISKNVWNAFTNPALDIELKKRKVTGIVIAGIATSIGIEGTARAASEHGYNLTFAQDAMTDMVAAAHANSINVIFPRIGEVGNTTDIIEKLQILS